MKVVDELSYSVWALAKQRNKTKSKRKQQQKKKQTNKDLYLKSNVSNAALARNDYSVAKSLQCTRTQERKQICIFKTERQ